MTRKLLLGMMVAVMALGMAFAGCAGGNSALTGTWDDPYEPGSAWRFRNGNFYMLWEDEPLASGTYTARGGRLAVTMTDAICCCIWELEEVLAGVSYSVSGDTLTIWFEEGRPGVFTRRR